MINFAQIGSNKGGLPFFNGAGSRAPAPMRAHRAFFGVARNHQQYTDRRGNSTTSLTIGTGSKTLTFSAPITTAANWEIGGQVAIRWAPELANDQTGKQWMIGTLTEISATSVTVAVTDSEGSGTLALWDVQAMDTARAGWPSGFVTQDRRLVLDWDYVTDVATLSSIAEFGTAGGFASRTSGGLEANGIKALVLADGNNGLNAWAGVIEAARTHTGAGSITALELNATQAAGPSPANLGVDPELEFDLLGRTPYKSYATGESVGLRVAGGSSARSFGRSYWNDAAIFVQDNGAPFSVGLSFHAQSLVREGNLDDLSPMGTTGYARAVEMAYDHGVAWKSRDPDGAFGSGRQREAFRIRGATIAPDRRMEMLVNDSGISWNELTSPNGVLAAISWRADAASYVRLMAGGTGQAARLQAQGIAPSVNLLAEGKGPSGLFGFGTFTDPDEDGTGYVRIVTAAGQIIRLTGTLES